MRYGNHVLVFLIRRRDIDLILTYRGERGGGGLHCIGRNSLVTTKRQANNLWTCAGTQIRHDFDSNVLASSLTAIAAMSVSVLSVATG